MEEIYLSSVMDDYLVTHGYTDYSGILLSKKGEILYSKYHIDYSVDQLQDISFLVPGIISLLTGIALDRHYIKSVEVPIRTILPEFDLGIDHLHRIIKIKHLLSMSSGILWSSSKLWLTRIYRDLLTLNNPAMALSDVLVANVPGMQYYYKEWDFILLATILEKVLHCSLDEFCQEALLKPLGINVSEEDFSISSESIIQNFFSTRQSINLSIADLHKIAEMLINKGKYQNKRIISAGYIREMLTPQKTNAEYGYMWSIYPYGYGINDRYGQSFTIVPDQEICYILLTRHKYTRKDYNGVFTKLREELLNTLSQEESYTEEK